MDFLFLCKLYVAVGTLLLVADAIYGKVAKNLWPWEEESYLIPHSIVMPLVFVFWLPMLCIGWYRPFGFR